MKLYTIFSVMLAGALTLNAARADDNVHFSGALVAEPCELPDADTDIHIDFGTVITKYLYRYQRTKSKSFTIHLENCDPTVMNQVSVTFVGTPDEELTDMLAVDTSSNAKGIAIGFELQNSAPLKINKEMPYKEIIKGSNELIFNAFVQAEPKVISTQSLVVGDFMAISSFVLTYQ